MEENKNSEEIKASEQESKDVAYESNAQRRLRLLGIENDSKIHDQSQEITKGNFWANLWYKRKWTIIISAFFIIMAIILACTIIFKERIDLSVGYIGPNEEKIKTYMDVFEPCVKDVDKDGKKELSLNTTQYYSKENLGDNNNAFAEDANKKALDSFHMDIRNNNFVVVFIDKSLYEEFDEQFFTIDELISLGAKIDKEQNKDILYGAGIVVGHTKLAYNNGINDPNVLICFPKTNFLKKDASAQIEFLNNILSYENTKN